jgi:uncharacterized protein (TIGR02594 family)
MWDHIAGWDSHEKPPLLLGSLSWSSWTWTASVGFAAEEVVTLVYTVKSGDSMSKIAVKHGVSVGALIRANPQVDDPSMIFPGQKLQIPGQPDATPPSSVPFSDRYRVRSGDTMTKIARAFRVSLSALVAANPQIRNPDKIKVGQIIHVPPTQPGENVQPITSPPGGSTPKWYRTAKREMDDGTVEVPGASEHNPRILEYHASVTGGFDENEIPWCSSFVNWCMEQADIRGTDSAAARSWEKWGKKLSKPKRGAVAVFWRDSKTSPKGHVGFYVDENSTHVSVLGGNQGDRVSIEKYPKARLLGYRWPRS